MAFDIVAAMDGIGNALGSIAGLRILPYQGAAIQAPAAIVLLPAMTYDFTMARGSDLGLFTVHVWVSQVDDKSATTAVAGYMAASGTNSVKQAIEADPSLGGAVMTVRVQSATVQVMSMGGVDYLTCSFTVEVVA